MACAGYDGGAHRCGEHGCLYICWLTGGVPSRTGRVLRPGRNAILILIVLVVAGCATERSTAVLTLRGQSTPSQAVQVQGPECLSKVDASSAAGQQSSSGNPASPGPVSPNASRVVADVLKRSVWAPGTLPVPPLPSNPDRAVFSLSLSVASSTALAPEYENLAFPGSTVEAFSCTAVPAELTGQRIAAILTLAGEPHATRWWISDIHVRP